MIFINSISKRIDSLGRIVIPKDLRKKMDLEVGELLKIEYIENKIIISKTNMPSKTKKFLNLIISNLNYLIRKDIILFDISGNIYKSNEKLEFEKPLINKFKTKTTSTFYKNNNIFPIYIDGYLYGGLIIINYINEEKRIINSYINLIEKYIEQ